jgi:hypothetical protein
MPVPFFHFPFGQLSKAFISSITPNIAPSAGVGTSTLDFGVIKLDANLLLFSHLGTDGVFTLALIMLSSSLNGLLVRIFFNGSICSIS